MAAEPAYLLDSNVCIYILDGSPPEARRRLERCRPGEVVASAITYAEVMRGIDRQRPSAREAAERLFGLVSVLPFDRAAADAFRRIPFSRGRFDRLIAAHALARDLTVVTNNVADFSDVPDLRIENWTLPPEAA